MTHLWKIYHEKRSFWKIYQANKIFLENLSFNGNISMEIDINGKFPCLLCISLETKVEGGKNCPHT
jgi:hypothetical protein